MPIIDDLLFAVKLLSALGCGLMAGLFFAFSVSVMRALAALPSAAGLAAMQSINVAIINPMFLAAFFGTAVACLLIYNGRLALTVARSRCNLPARRQLIVSTRHFSCDARLQRT
jgi:uncharacterized membrane protein